MKNEAYIGVDLGTSNVKAMALDYAGSCIAYASQRLPIARGPDGKAEQHPISWEEITGKCLRDLSGMLKEKSFHPAGVAATGQMNGPVLLNRSGAPLRAVPLWCDTRCAPQCEKIERLMPKKVLLEKTGHTAVTGYTAPKLMWLMDHEPEVIKAASHLLLPKDYITKLLTEEIYSDFSDASNTLLFDIHRGVWDEEIIRTLDLDSIGFPSLASSIDPVGKISGKGAIWSGLPQGTPVAAGAGDSIAAALGAGIYGPSILQIVIGSAGDVNCVVGEIVIDSSGRIHTGLFVDRHHWIISGVLQASGASMQWWSEITGRDLDQLMSEVTRDNPPEVMFAPYLAGERTPHLDPHVRGAFILLSGNTTRADMTRAVLEGIAFSFRDAIEVFHGLGIRPHQISLTGGGITGDILCQILASVIGLPMQRIATDVTARGTAVLAACVAGRFSHWQEGASAWPLRGDSFLPDETSSYQRAYPRFRKLYPHLADFSGHPIKKA